nr:HAD hydrolase-like protein [Clostridiales bacterium]
MLKLVIFDMDGVLIDSEDAITKAALEALKSGWNIDAKYEDFKQFTGMGENKFIGSVAEMYGVPYTLEMKDLTYKIYCDTAVERVTVYPWSKKLIESLLNIGLKTAVASAADTVKVKCNLECIGIDTSCFSALITGSEVEKNKPNPDIFLAAAKKAG